MIKIVILDKINDFPFLDNFIESEIKDGYDGLYTVVWENDIDKLKILAEEYYSTIEQPLPIFSFDISLMNRVLNDVPSVTPFFITVEKSEFKESYEEFKELNKFRFIPRIKISSTKEVDLLEVSNLFSKSDQKKLKYINGEQIPIIIDYEGMDTFNYINSLNSGVLIPATKYDIEVLKNPDKVITKKNIIIQIGEENKFMSSFSYTLNSNKTFGLVWTNIEKYHTSEVEELYSDLKFPKDLQCNVYLELEKHKDTLFVNKVIQGIHPYVYYSKK